MPYENSGHAQYCKDCYRTLSPYQPHDYDSTGHCTVCGRLNPNLECTHTHTAYKPLGTEGHVRYCSDCLVDLSGVEPHHKVGNKCDLCGFDKFDCSHEHTVLEYSAYYHTFFCNDCNTLLDSSEHIGMDDGVCDKCGYAANAEHHYASGTHNCTDPGCSFVSLCVDNDPKDCRCDICNGEFHNNIVCKDFDDTTHERVCTDCKENAGKYPHIDYDKDGKCDECGHKMSGTTGGGTTGGNDGKKDPTLDNVPKTGDVMAPVAILSGLMSVAAVFTRKRFF